MKEQDEILVEGIQYVSSKRAAALTGYARDYVGQLARQGQVEAQRIGALWYISLNSLNAYKENSEPYKPEPYKEPLKNQKDLESYISFDGKDYISASRASKLTGYNQDYIGQLARSGKILSRRVGNRWYIDGESILAHKEEKDTLLGAVQSESVGLASKPVTSDVSNFLDEGPILNYVSDTADLLPKMSANDDFELDIPIHSHKTHTLQIHTPHAIERIPKRQNYSENPVYKTNSAQNRYRFVPVTVGLLTIVILLSFGFASFKSNSIYALNKKISAGVTGLSSLTASPSQTLSSIGDFLETWLAPEIEYKRAP